MRWRLECFTYSHMMAGMSPTKAPTYATTPGLSRPGLVHVCSLPVVVEGQGTVLTRVTRAGAGVLVTIAVFPGIEPSCVCY